MVSASCYSLCQTKADAIVWLQSIICTRTRLNSTSFIQNSLNTTLTGLIDSSQTPVLNDVRDITLARNERNGLVALVSYENKVC